LLERLTQFGEQPQVLDGDHSLVGKDLEDLDVLVGESLNMAARQHHDADRGVFAP